MDCNTDKIGKRIAEKETKQFLTDEYGKLRREIEELRFTFKAITLILLLVTNLFTGLMASQWRQIYDQARAYIKGYDSPYDDVRKAAMLTDTRIHFKNAVEFDTLKVGVLVLTDKVMESR